MTRSTTRAIRWVLVATTLAALSIVVAADVAAPTITSVTITTSSTDGAGASSTTSPGAEAGGGGRGGKGRTFWPAFVSSLIVIILAELGDKTFFIAAIGALKHPRMILFLGAYGALFLMTILSTGMGYAAGYISHTFTHWVSVILFLYFGVTLLKNGLEMDAAESAENKNKEMEEVEEEVAKAAGASPEDTELLEAGGQPAEGSAASMKAHERATAHVGTWRTAMRACVSPIFLQFFIMTFAAEWGDRSQIATVSLASTDDPLGVTLGALLGHALCTGLAVLGGKLLATKISERTVTILGGVTFLLCALLTVVEGFRAAVPEAAAAAAATGH